MKEREGYIVKGGAVSYSQSQLHREEGRNVDGRHCVQLAKVVQSYVMQRKGVYIFAMLLCCVLWCGVE